MTAARFPRPNPGIICLLAGTGLVAVYFACARGSLAQALIYQAVGVLAALTIAAATLIRKPERSRHWWLLVAFVALWTTADGIFNAYRFVLHREPSYPGISDWSYLAGYVAMLFAMRALVQSRNRPGLSDLLDAVVIACGSGLVFWVVLIKPVAGGTGVSLAGQLLSIADPTFDLVLLVVLSQLLLTRGRQSFAFGALVAGAVLLFGADVLYSLDALSGSYVSGSWIDGGWLLNYVLWAAAACHPSMRKIHKFVPAPRTRMTWQRLTVLGGASVTVPAVLVHESPGHPVELIVLGVISTLIILFVLLRMALLFREHARSAGEFLEAEGRRELERQSTERFEAAARVLDCAIYEVTPENEVLWTEGLTTAFGYELAEVESTRDWWLDRVHPDDRAAIEAETTASLVEGREGYCEFRWLAKNGEYRDVWDRWLTISSADGKQDRQIGSLVDVTERNRLQDALHQSRKIEAIGKLAGGVAHDFNNLLLSVTVAAELAIARAEDDPDLQELLNEISEAADRGASLTQQLLTFSHQQAVEQRVIDLEASVDALAPMLRRLLGADVAVQSDLAVDLWKVKADPTHIDQVLMNLCVNARDAMPNGGVVKVAAHNVVLGAADAERLGIKAGDYAAISVSDSGHGMDAETAARVFEPFFTTKEQGKGTGLGLSTVYGIAGQSGGAVGVETALGRGTTFTLYLPRTEEEVAPADEEPGEPEPEGHSEKILLVEDERSVRTLIRRLLEVEGYIVVTADSAEDALVVAGREKGIDLVLTDMVMPGMNGRELVEVLERSRPDMKVVYTSGYFDDRAAATHGAPFLQKPYTHQALARTVREALAS